MIRIMTRIGLHSLGNIFLMEISFFFSVLPSALFRTQTKVYDGVVLQK